MKTATVLKCHFLMCVCRLLSLLVGRCWREKFLLDKKKFEKMSNYYASGLSKCHSNTKSQLNLKIETRIFVLNDVLFWTKKMNHVTKNNTLYCGSNHCYHFSPEITLILTRQPYHEKEKYLNKKTKSKMKGNIFFPLRLGFVHFFSE